MKTALLFLPKLLAKLLLGIIALAFAALAFVVLFLTSILCYFGTICGIGGTLVALIAWIFGDWKIALIIFGVAMLLAAIPYSGAFIAGILEVIKEKMLEISFNIELI